MNNENSNVQSPVTEVQNKGGVNTSLDFVGHIIGSFLKPLKTFKKNEGKLDNAKNSFILLGIVSAIMMVASILSSIITAVRISSVWTGETKWVWENLKYLKWGDLIFKNLFMYAILILALAGVFFIASLIIKKQTSFNKTLSITAVSFLPIAAGILLATILGIIWSDLSLILMVCGFVYSLTTFASLMNEHFKLEGDVKVYTYAACFAVYIIALYYVAINVLKVALTSGF